MSGYLETGLSELSCLFWNVRGSDRTELICELVNEHSADIIVLVEPPKKDDLLMVLQERESSSFFIPDADTERLRVLARDPDLSMREVYGTTTGRMTIRSLRCFEEEFLFVAMHIPSRASNWTEDDQTAELTQLCEALRAEEDRRGHRRTLLVGDLNMNPFDNGIMQTTGLHAAMTRQTAEAGHRVVQENAYPYFYNPMWGFFGDRTSGPPGTHYYRGKHISYDWNIYDQVLVRPDAIPWFDDRIEIVHRIGDTNLLTRNGRPNPSVGSDHLPLSFGLKQLSEE
ncbi:MAG: endonuclease/exonuclease/phosphatase family protein [Planctomycetales bacterium]